MLNASSEEFAREASEVNDDRGLKLTGGRIGSNDGWLGRGAFAVKEVEDAVWALQPGQVSEVIEVNNAFYIARLEDRKVGRVRSFDDQQVQKEIDARLRQPQVDARLKQLEQRLLREAVISPAQPVLEPVLEMAMQKYHDWRVK
jgi:parvulin-like peptidyl-prolyl isomerase